MYSRLFQEYPLCTSGMHPHRSNDSPSERSCRYFRCTLRMASTFRSSGRPCFCVGELEKKFSTGTSSVTGSLSGEGWAIGDGSYTHETRRDSTLSSDATEACFTFHHFTSPRKRSLSCREEKNQQSRATLTRHGALV